MSKRRAVVRVNSEVEFSQWIEVAVDLKDRAEERKMSPSPCSPPDEVSHRAGGKTPR